MSTPRLPKLSDADVHLLTRIESGETTFRPSSVLRAGETIQKLVERLLSLRDHGLVALSDSRIMRNQTHRILGAGPCSLTPAGRQALDQDRRLGPRA